MDQTSPHENHHHSFQNSPGSELWKWADLLYWDDWIPRLAEKALPERWTFSPTEATGARAYPLLVDYLEYTFYRLKHEKKVRSSVEDRLAAFNTGLVDRGYEPIYACFEASKPGSTKPWRLLGFFRADEDSIGDRLVRTFNPLPERARYLTRKEDVLLDPSIVPVVDFDHVLIDNIDRLPRQLLDRELHDNPEELELVERAHDETAERDMREAAFESLREMLRGDRVRSLRLKDEINDAVALALERVKWSYRTAVPAYYPRKNSINLLLPLDLTEDETPDIALVVEYVDNGSYIGQTIFTTQMAYKNARLICRPDSDWLEASFKSSKTEKSSRV